MSARRIVTAFAVADLTGWNMDMSAAPRDGTVVNVVARYPHATAGFPRYAAFNDGRWVEYSKGPPEEVVPWAWRSRDSWPSEPPKSPEAPWADHDGESWPEFSPADLIEVERRNGYGHTDHACGFMWLSSGSPYDIIRYRKVAS